MITNTKSYQEENELLIHHQDELKKFKLKRGGFSFSRGLLSISIETENIKKSINSFPDCANLCIENLVVPNGILMIGQEYSHIGGREKKDAKGTVRCCGYFTFHAQKLHMKILIKSIVKNEILISISAIHEDVVYYDERAKDCHAAGVFRINKKPKTQLWIPS